jgi:CheY-like chemotaxis protein/signal transduction histidine kinase
MGSQVIGYLSESLDALMATLHVAQDDGRFRRVADLGVAEADRPADVARAADGLMAQAIKEGRALHVRDVPEGYLPISSSLGKAKARELLIIPLATDGAVLGVLELGFFRALLPSDVELVNRIAEPVAFALASAQYKARLRDLLEESQRQAEELQSQQSEMEAQQAELEATNEEISQTNALMEVQTEELERQRDEVAQAREVADKASRYKSEFLANMSHELRTPLNSSLILARLLADNREGNLTADQIRSAETIYGAGNDLLVLINDILDLSKIEAGRADVTSETVHVSQLADALERSFRPVADERRVQLRITRSERAPAQLVTDGRRLEQILKNLLSNAFKFTASGEVELTISADGASADAADGAERLRFAVRDTGIGIAPPQKEVIFEAFRQADGTTSRKYGGTGLGLSISRELTHLLGGELIVESVFGQGSTFSFSLPLDGSTVQRGEPGAASAATATARPSMPAMASGSAAHAPTSAAHLTSRRTRTRPVTRQPVDPAFPDDRTSLTREGRLILAVEDDPAFARILFDLAHELDFDCVIAATGDDGLALARELQPSGVLLDIGLPDASGLSVLERLKRDPATRHIPIHMVSSSDYEQTALELGAIGFAFKPVAREQLIAAFEKLRERHVRTVRHVLVVEDDVRQQESIAKLLGGQGVELVLAGSVKEALAQLEKVSVDCMVLDLTLPDGSGHDLLQKMAEGTRYSFPPVIVYTGRELERADEEKLLRYSRSIIVKGARSPERLLDEVTLFLHQVESSLPAEQRRLLADARQREAVFEGRRILIVEDDVRNVFALSKVLEPRGAKVEIARNGREALAALERVPSIDLVLMDIMMPEMDGLTAMREIRKQDAFKRLPIIALTAKAMADDREQAMHAGANDYMAKPFEVDKLISLCRVWLRR